MKRKENQKINSRYVHRCEIQIQFQLEILRRLFFCFSVLLLRFSVQTCCGVYVISSRQVFSIRIVNSSCIVAQSAVRSVVSIDCDKCFHRLIFDSNSRHSTKSDKFDYLVYTHVLFWLLIDCHSFINHWLSGHEKQNPEKQKRNQQTSKQIKT